MRSPLPLARLSISHCSPEAGLHSVFPFQPRGQEGCSKAIRHVVASQASLVSLWITGSVTSKEEPVLTLHFLSALCPFWDCQVRKACPHLWLSSSQRTEVGQKAPYSVLHKVWQLKTPRDPQGHNPGGTDHNSPGLWGLRNPVPDCQELCSGAGQGPIRRGTLHSQQGSLGSVCVCVCVHMHVYMTAPP